MNFLINVFILTFSSFIIKALGLFNKVLLTRILGIEGMSLLSLSYPTISLFLTISSFGLSLSIGKRISEGRKNNRSLIIKCFILSTFISTLLSIILFLFLRTITNTLLNNPNLYYPILVSIPLIYLTGYSSILKGYFHGNNKANINSYSNIIEQIVRILFCFIISIYLLKINIIYAVCGAIVANFFGELFSILFLLFKAKKITKLNIRIKNQKEITSILSISIPLTLSRIIQAITIFFEPIVFTYALRKTGLKMEKVTFLYTIMHTFSLPLLTLFQIIPASISIALLPLVSKGENIHYYIKKSISFVIMPAIFITVSIFSYSSELIYLLFKSTEGGLYVKYMSLIFFLTYFQSIYITVLQGINKISLVLKFNTILSILDLVLIFFVSKYNPVFTLAITFSTTIIIGFIGYLIMLNKYIDYKIKISELLKTLFVLLSSLLIGFYIKSPILGMLIIFLYCLIFYHKNYKNFKEISSDE